MMNELLESVLKSAGLGTVGHMGALRHALMATAALDGHRASSECVFCVNIGATTAKAVLTRAGATLAKVEWQSNTALPGDDAVIAVLAERARATLSTRLEEMTAAVNIVLGRG